MEQERKKSKIRIFFFIGYLGTGGKERRLIELLGYLNNKRKYELLLVTTKEGVELPKFFDLDIKMVVLKKNIMISKLNYFFHFYQLMKKFDPDIIHTWGRMQTLYALPAVVIGKKKLINGQITSAPPNVSFMDSLIDKINFRYSDVVLSNSKAGIEVFNPPKKKAGVIYNGLDLDRFQNLPNSSEIKKQYQINTPYLVLMIANFTPNKDYERFFKAGQILTEKRKDVTWMGVGDFEEESNLVKSCRHIIGDNALLRIHQRITEVEALVNACDIGVLLSNTAVHGEGVSNSIIEYMALAKPVVANDAGGTREVVINEQTGFLVHNETMTQVVARFNHLLDHHELRLSMGLRGQKKIYCEFSLNKMGVEFESLYNNILKH
ncbi:MAG TPA: glycosyltransferase [Aequorivita sp.]|nr:glycosyltransferase [Aequorivita sp.]